MDGKPPLQNHLTSQEVHFEGLIPEISNRIAAKCLAGLPALLPPLAPPRGHPIVPKPLKSKKGGKEANRWGSKEGNMHSNP